MNENNINISSIYNRVPGFSKNHSTTSNDGESFTKISEVTEKKIRNCFGKLMKNIQNYGTTLGNVFNNFDT